MKTTIITHILVLMIFTACGADKGSQDNGNEEAQDSDVCEDLKEAPETPDNGSLAIVLASNVDPCSVKVQVVGGASLETYLEGNIFTVANTGVGTKDIIATGESLAIQLVDGAKVGLRINDIEVSSSSTTKIEDIKLLPLVELTGNAKLLEPDGVTDHSGITVYVPGTDYIAKTDKDGNYKFTDFPQGVHELYFEKDSYSRAQLQKIEVTDKEKALQDVGLIQSLGSGGGFKITNGHEIDYYGKSVTLLTQFTAELAIAPTDGTTRMTVSNYPDFNDSATQPITSAASLELKTSEPQTEEGLTLMPLVYGYGESSDIDVYVRFSDDDGYETITSKRIIIDLFSDGEKLFEPAFDLSFSPDYSTLKVRNIVVPDQGTKMSVQRNRGSCLLDEHGNSSCPPLVYEDSKTSYDFTIATEGLESCSKQVVDIRFTDESNTYISKARGETDESHHFLFRDDCSETLSRPTSVEKGIINGSATTTLANSKLFSVSYNETELIFQMALYDLNDGSSVNPFDNFGSLTNASNFTSYNSNAKVYLESSGNKAFLFVDNGINTQVMIYDDSAATSSKWSEVDLGIASPTIFAVTDAYIVSMDSNSNQARYDHVNSPVALEGTTTGLGTVNALPNVVNPVFASVGNVVYAMGGKTTGGSPTENYSCHKYDSSTDTWSNCIDSIDSDFADNLPLWNEDLRAQSGVTSDDLVFLADIGDDGVGIYVFDLATEEFTRYVYDAVDDFNFMINEKVWFGVSDGFAYILSETDHNVRQINLTDGNVIKLGGMDDGSILTHENWTTWVPTGRDVIDNSGILFYSQAEYNNVENSQEIFIPFQ
ncbi:carboxypeptidase-like regulatory domain-containing protein [Oligoflexaceae bacterium]|nr:carboxypeptidase-like regulatory domain-containing protein [Oligoflexaceae bacterium]